MQLSELVRLSPEDNSDTLVALPPPEGTLEKADPAAVQDAARPLIDAWRRVSSPKFVVPPASVSVTCSGCGEKTVYSGTNLRDRLAMVLGAYYDATVRRLLALEREGVKGGGEPGTPLIPGLNLHEHQQYMADRPNLANPAESRAWLMHTEYMQSLQAAYFFALFKRTAVPDQLLAPFESLALQGLTALHHACMGSRGSLRQLGDRLAHSILHILDGALRTDATLVKRHRPGPFSQVRTAELEALAARDPVMGEKYGEHRIAKLFEHQLALLIQSLGLYVVSTRTGERAVDLVCISPDPNALTFLLEAKSSKDAYELPVSDERALVEYVAESRRTLTTLPPLRFVLVVGSRAADSVESRLARLEMEAGLPVRFMPAAELAALREAIVGSLPIQSFVDALLTSTTRVIREGFADAVARASSERHRAHIEFVRALSAPAVRNREPNLAAGWCEGAREPQEAAEGPKARARTKGARQKPRRKSANTA